ncbi:MULTISPECIES: hypothetical protein, partial [Pseudomonas]
NECPSQRGLGVQVRMESPARIQVHPVNQFFNVLITGVYSVKIWFTGSNFQSAYKGQQMHFVRNMTGADVCRRLLYETGGISDGLIPAKKPYWFDVKA